MWELGLSRLYASDGLALLCCVSSAFLCVWWLLSEVLGGRRASPCPSISSASRAGPGLARKRNPGCEPSWKSWSWFLRTSLILELYVGLPEAVTRAVKDTYRQTSTSTRPRSQSRSATYWLCEITYN